VIPFEYRIAVTYEAMALEFSEIIVWGQVLGLSAMLFYWFLITHR